MSSIFRYLNIIREKDRGQSLLELVVGVGIFLVVIYSLAFFIIDSYSSGRLSYEVTRAVFLAQEGLEATISIRDNSWGNLNPGPHGLSLSEEKWVFLGSEEDLSSELREGKRSIFIEDLSSDTKKVTSKISWQFTENRPQEIELVTYLTNWQTISSCQGTCLPCENFLNQGSCRNQAGCDWQRSSRICEGFCTPCGNFSDQEDCQEQSGCGWVR